MADPLSAPAVRHGLFRRSIQDSRFGQMHVRLTGHFSVQRPPLVLLHATPRTGAMYDQFMPLFADRLVVAPDRLGFGFSDVLQQPLEMPQYAQTTLDVLDALEVDRFDVLGTQSGSAEAVELAWGHAERVRKVVLVGIPVSTPDEIDQQQQDLLAGPPAPVEDGSHLAWYWQRQFAHRQAPFDLPLLQWDLRQDLLAAQVGWAQQAVFDYPLAEHLGEIEQPLLVLAPHDDVWQQTLRLKQTGGLPAGARFVELPRLDLDVTYTAAEEVANLVRTFLDDAGAGD